MNFDLKRKIKIACYGYAEKKCGSVAGANFFILEELLKRGYEIDFYGVKSFVYPEELLRYKNFQYISFLTPTWANIIHSFILNFPREAIKNFLMFIWRPTVDHIYWKAILKTAKETQAFKKYDLLLFLGLFSRFRLKGIPVISWIQGPPQTEWEAIRKLKNEIILYCGKLKFIQFNIHYIQKMILQKLQRIFKKTDTVVCGSQWSKEELVLAGLDKRTIKVLPYPIDTDFFLPDKEVKAKKDKGKTILCLGRLDPRKRLSLLLDAFRLLLKERRDVYLKIIGKFSYVPEYKKLIDGFELPQHISYREHIDRREVPALMNSVDILIQPSENENFGSSVAEALCCGVPVIVGPTNGTKDYIGQSSFIFDKYTPESLKETMARALEAVEKEKTRLAYDARSAAVENFAVAGIVDRLEKIFAETIDKCKNKITRKRWNA